MLLKGRVAIPFQGNCGSSPTRQQTCTGLDRFAQWLACIAIRSGDPSVCVLLRKILAQSGLALAATPRFIEMMAGLQQLGDARMGAAAAAWVHWIWLFGPRFRVAGRMAVHSNAASYTESAATTGLHAVIVLDKAVFTPMVPAALAKAAVQALVIAPLVLQIGLVVLDALVFTIRHVLLSAAEVARLMLVVVAGLLVVGLSALSVLLKSSCLIPLRPDAPEIALFLLQARLILSKCVRSAICQASSRRRPAMLWSRVAILLLLHARFMHAVGWVVVILLLPYVRSAGVVVALRRGEKALAVVMHSNLMPKMLAVVVAVAELPRLPRESLSGVLRMRGDPMVRVACTVCTASATAIEQFVAR